MKIRVLGASGSEMPGYNLPAFLIDDRILMDAGTIGLALNDDEQWRIKHILLTHAHIDHIKGIPFFLDNLIVRNKKHTVTIISGREVLEDIKRNVFNDRIWPDFTKIPSAEEPVLRFKAINRARSINIDGYRVFAEKMNHAVPDYGYIIEGKDKKAVAYTGDTGPTDLFWKMVSLHDVRCLIIETSLPNSMSELASRSGHLSASLLKKEMMKMTKTPPLIVISHAKPQFLSLIEKEIRALGFNNIRILRDGQTINI
ncbi:MAG: 3',5'-cyclic-nucleotide phosphodiesterase [Thermodesulfovibrionales bacterium]